MLFTAGSEGVIKCWSFPPGEQVDQYSATQNKNFCTGTWSSHDEAIWQLNVHPYEVEYFELKYKQLGISVNYCLLLLMEQFAYGPLYRTVNRTNL
jgi:hypothetical protein